MRAGAASERPANRPAPGGARPGPDLASILAALPTPVFVIDAADRFRYVNAAAEQFFEASAVQLAGRSLGELIVPDSPLHALIAQSRGAGAGVTEHGVTVDSPRTGPRSVTIKVTPGPGADEVVVALEEHSIARKIDQHLVHRNAARSVSAMAAMLAHEVKNPLSGIKGAAQLLEQNAAPADVELTRLISEEADRIVALVERMDMFADHRPIERAPVNIHEVLGHVRRLAESGFARQRRFIEQYDPSLPPVLGNRDLLVQAFLNIVKNASEAAPARGGEIVLGTRYRQGVRLALPGAETRLELPLVVSVQDNGSGIPEDLQAHLFEPFVTTKSRARDVGISGGRGLGLALVAKVVGDHGGIVEFESEPRRTVFRVFLPVAASAEEES